jgi:soluble cytochrome b562
MAICPIPAEPLQPWEDIWHIMQNVPKIGVYNGLRFTKTMAEYFALFSGTLTDLIFKYIAKPVGLLTNYDKVAYLTKWKYELKEFSRQFSEFFVALEQNTNEKMGENHHPVNEEVSFKSSFEKMVAVLDEAIQKAEKGVDTKGSVQNSAPAETTKQAEMPHELEEVLQNLHRFFERALQSDTASVGAPQPAAATLEHEQVSQGTAPVAGIVPQPAAAALE